MSAADPLAEHFERLCDLPAEQQRRAIDELGLDPADRDALIRLLAADQGEGDPIR